MVIRLPFLLPDRDFIQKVLYYLLVPAGTFKDLYDPAGKLIINSSILQKHISCFSFCICSSIVRSVDGYWAERPGP